MKWLESHIQLDHVILLKALNSSLKSAVKINILHEDISLNLPSV